MFSKHTLFLLYLLHFMLYSSLLIFFIINENEVFLIYLLRVKKNNTFKRCFVFFRDSIILIKKAG